MENLIIIGIGTNARHALEFIQMYNLYNVIGFAVNKEYIKEDNFQGYPIYDIEKIKENVKVPFKVFVALLWNRLNQDRRNLFEYCQSQGFEFVNLISPHAIIRKSSSFGKNCWFHDFVVVQNDAHIGDNVAVMAYSLIGADTKVGSHCFFGAKSLLAGGCTIGEQCFVGINATIFDDTHIGDKCIIGSCTAVKRNMPSYSKYTTPSDNIVIKQYNGDEILDKLQFKLNVR